jgi:hypothetical protein
MILSTDSKYPSRRAYVIKVRSDAIPGSLAGRLENLVTGQRFEFSSEHELVRLITNDMIGLVAPDGL